MKISELTIQGIKDYCKVEYAEDDILLNAILIASKAYIKNYTGLTDEQMKEKEDLTLVAYVLCSEMFENRQYTVDKITVNPIIQSILDMHCINFL